MTFDLSGRTALVTGASSGLGAHFAVTLAATGARVILAARRVEALQALAERLRTDGGAVETLVLDVADTAALDAAAAQFADVDVLVNNAGVVSEGSAFNQTEQDWDRVLDTNLKAMFLLSQHVGKAMRARGGGSIINIASVLGLRQASGVLPYAVSKAGVIQLTKTLALEWARHGIRVNAIAPGYISTALNSEFWEAAAGQALIARIPQRRLGDITDLDGPLLLLASDASRYMTGSVLSVDGGHQVSTL